MKIINFLLIAALFFSPVFVYPKRVRKKQLANQVGISMTQSDHLYKSVLSNGMTILVRPVHEIPKVSMQLWYHVGSKDEKNGERGIAHLIEHMIFKGTYDLFSESDINMLVHKLSGSCNAFTSYDYTGYLFNMPTHHWREMLPVMADCMSNVRFDKDMLASELKAVIQELKMYRDKYTRTLLEDLLSTIFADHPYHYPIIGFKQDLWNADAELLRQFYTKHYHPNNATLVVVGDVDPCDVVARAEEYFGSIKADEKYLKETFYHNRDLATKSVTLYRDVKQPFAALTWRVPGMSEGYDQVLSALELILGRGRSSRLYKKLVHELQLVTSLQVGTDSLFEHSLLFIGFEPKDIADIPRIEEIIHAEIADIMLNGVTQAECERALKMMRMDLYSTLEDIEQQAYMIGQYYLATGNPEYIFTSLDIQPDTLQQEIQKLVQTWLRISLVHKGAVLPLAESEKGLWQELQVASDTEDQAILAAHIRETEIEPARYADTVDVRMPEPFSFPRPHRNMLKNGVKLLSHVNKNTPQVTLILSLRVKSYYDDPAQLGIGMCVAAMLKEGTKNYSATEFADLIESRGMSLSTAPGFIEITALKEDLAFALEIVHEIITNAAFEAASLEKVRDQMIAQINNFWDNPNAFAGQLIKEALYKQHPYAKNPLGTLDTVRAFTVDDLKKYYAQYMSPDGARLAIVGDIEGVDVVALADKYCGEWTGLVVEKLVLPPVLDTQTAEINYPINRDQIVLAFAKKSIDRLHPDYDKYLVYNQIFGGGNLGSMSSRLFDLREQSGLFYTISGSLLVGADEAPGLFMVKTIVSKDRLAEAQVVIRDAIAHAHDTITEEECQEAKQAIVNTVVDNFASNSSIAQTFLFLDRFNLSERYFDDRAQQLEAINVSVLKSAVAKCMNSDNLVTLKVGRIE